MSTLPANTDFYNLSSLAVARVEGDDARHFLQGQLSNDIVDLDQGQSHQMSAYCNPKGRMLALFHVLKFSDAYALIAPREIMDKVLPRLGMFVMRAAVDIQRLNYISLTGIRVSGQADSKALDALRAQSLLLAQHHNDPERYFLLSEHMPEGVQLDENDWNLLDIEQCLPQVYEETCEALIPQSVNLDLAGGVNFKKGCYPGQEIIARIKYRGKPKTRMIPVKAPASVELEIGASIFIDGKDSAAGQIINVATTGDSKLFCISTPVTHISEGALYADDGRSIKFERIDCPYPIPL